MTKKETAFQRRIALLGGFRSGSPPSTRDSGGRNASPRQQGPATPVPAMPPSIIVSNRTPSVCEHSRNGKRTRINGHAGMPYTCDNITSIGDEANLHSCSYSVAFANIQPDPQHQQELRVPTAGPDSAMADPLMAHGGFGAVLGFNAAVGRATMQTPPSTLAAAPTTPPLHGTSLAATPATVNLLSPSQGHGGYGGRHGAATAAMIPAANSSVAWAGAAGMSSSLAGAASINPSPSSDPCRPHLEFGGSTLASSTTGYSPAHVLLPSVGLGGTLHTPNRHETPTPPPAIWSPPLAPAPAGRSMTSSSQATHRLSPSDGGGHTRYPSAHQPTTVPASPTGNAAFPRHMGANHSSVADQMLHSTLTAGMPMVLPVGFGSSLSTTLDGFLGSSAESYLRSTNFLHTAPIPRSALSSGPSVNAGHLDATGSLSYGAVGAHMRGGMQMLLSSPGTAGFHLADAALRSTPQSTSGPPVSSTEAASGTSTLHSNAVDLGGSAFASPPTVGGASAPLLTPMDSILAEVNFGLQQAAPGDEGFKRKAMAALAARLTHHLNRAVSYAQLLRAPGINIEFGFSDRRAAMALYEYGGLLDDPQLEHPTRFQSRLLSYRFPPPNMELLREADAPDEGTVAYMLGAQELSRRRRAAIRQAQELTASHGDGAQPLDKAAPNHLRRIRCGRRSDAEGGDDVFRRPEEVRSHMRSAQRLPQTFWTDTDDSESSADDKAPHAHAHITGPEQGHGGQDGAETLPSAPPEPAEPSPRRLDQRHVGFTL